MLKEITVNRAIELIKDNKRDIVFFKDKLNGEKGNRYYNIQHTDIDVTKFNKVKLYEEVED